MPGQSTLPGGFRHPAGLACEVGATGRLSSWLKSS
jgi:hypothetical protein